jgi:hypothetical protein
MTREPTQPARTNTMVTVATAAPARRMLWRRLHMRCSVCLPGGDAPGVVTLS